VRYPNRWTVGEWTFYEVEEHETPGYEDQPLYAFATEHTPEGLPYLGELYLTLDYAMVAAVGEKHTGPREVTGVGVATAADWFMRMIGAHELKRAADDGTTALLNVIETTDGFPAVGEREYIERIEQGLATRGYVLARLAE
jgi:hypothetical protein